LHTIKSRIVLFLQPERDISVFIEMTITRFGGRPGWRKFFYLRLNKVWMWHFPDMPDLPCNVRYWA